MERYSYDRRRQAFKKASNEDAQELIVDVQGQAEKFLRRAKGMPEVLAELGAILETPEIVDHSRRAVQRIADVKAILLIAKSASDDISDMDEEFIKLGEELVAKGGMEGISQRDIDARIPRLNKLRALSQEAKKILDRLQNEEGIDWDASQWLDSKVVLYKELKKRAPDEDFGEWDSLVEGINTALESYSMEYLQEDVEEGLEDERPVKP